jgi:hypothetical protein
MSTGKSLFGVIALAASVIAIVLWMDLRKERNASADLQLPPSEVQRSIESSEVVPAVATAPAPATVQAPDPKSTVSQEQPRAEITPAMKSTVDLIQGVVNSQRKLLEDPEFRKMQMAQLRASIARSHPDFAEELRLSQDDAAKLLDLLAENQLAVTLNGPLPFTAGSPGERQEVVRAQQAIQQRQEESIQALLGSKYTQWQAYVQTLPARSKVTSMVTQLAQAGKPLTEVQARAVTTAMVSGYQRKLQESAAMQRPVANAPETAAERMQKVLKNAEESNRVALELAAPHVSADQLAALREQLERQSVQNAVTLRTQAERERQLQVRTP